jgi:predicted TIM-barrel fold metal-dependent hydrolase
MSANMQLDTVKTERANAGIIDCDIHPSPRSISDVTRYLPARWREYVKEYGLRLRQPLANANTYPKSQPALSRRDAWPPEGGPPGSSLAFMREQHLDFHNVAFGMLQPLSPRGMDDRNQEFGKLLCRAVNQWQVDEWTSQDARLRGAITVPGEDAQAAIKEIEHWAGHPGFSQISLVTRATEPLGRRKYWPIYEAAQRHALPLGLHSVGTNGHSTIAGWSSFYYEEHQILAMTICDMVSSFVLEGVFEHFPKLKVVAIEGGFMWVPSLAWRLDYHWERMRTEVPWVKRPPSEYIKEHIWFTTQPVDDPEDPEDLRAIIEWIGWDRLLFASDYPHWDQDDPRYAFKCRLSREERAALFVGNAEQLYGLS